MEIKNFITLEEKKEEREYKFLMENNAPLGETYEVLYNFLAKIADLMVQSMEKCKPQEEKKEEEE